MHKGGKKQKNQKIAWSKNKAHWKLMHENL